MKQKTSEQSQHKVFQSYLIFLKKQLCHSPHGDIKYVTAHRAWHGHVSQAFPSNNHTGDQVRNWCACCQDRQTHDLFRNPYGFTNLMNSNRNKKPQQQQVGNLRLFHILLCANPAPPMEFSTPVAGARQGHGRTGSWGGGALLLPKMDQKSISNTTCHWHSNNSTSTSKRTAPPKICSCHISISGTTDTCYVPGTKSWREKDEQYNTDPTLGLVKEKRL